MKNVSRKKSWCACAVQIHLDPPLIPVIKNKNYTKLENDCVKTKFHRDPMSKIRLIRVKDPPPRIAKKNFLVKSCVERTAFSDQN